MVAPVMRLFQGFVSPDENGQRVLFLASPRYPARTITSDPSSVLDTPGLEVAAGMDDVVGSGFYRVDRDGDTCHQDEQYRRLREDGIGDKVWDHTLEAYEIIESGRVFSG